jgi:hypothetical protein
LDGNTPNRTALHALVVLVLRYRAVPKSVARIKHNISEPFFWHSVILWVGTKASVRHPHFDLLTSNIRRISSLERAT